MPSVVLQNKDALDKALCILHAEVQRVIVGEPRYNLLHWYVSRAISAAMNYRAVLARAQMHGAALGL